MTALLEVNNLIVYFETSLAINSLSVKVERGEIVGILGRNGAGKTTLLNTISGLIVDLKKKEEIRGGEKITLFGEIKFKGEDITEEEPYKRVKKGIVLAPERHPVFPECSVIENLKISAHLRKGSEAKETLEYVFRLFPPLKELKEREAGLLSGGEQQMLTIGMALMAKPELLLLDEPLLGLSPAVQGFLVDAIRKIRDEMRVSILIAEQFARPLFPILDRGYIIESGSLVFSGTKEMLVNNPEVEAAYFGV